MSAPMPAAWGKKKSRKALKKARKKAKAVLPVRKVVKKKQLKQKRERKVSAPIAKQTNYSIGAPQFMGSKAIVVKHREYLQPITSVTAFTGAGRYVLQPGLQDSFPWLGQIAGSFENYVFTDVKYIYRNRQGTTSNTTIYTGVQYDVADAEFKSIDEMMTYAGARSEVSWKDFSVDCLLKRGRAYKKYFIRTDTLPAGMDYQLFDSALFTICAVGPSAGTYCGDLLVEYTVRLMNPKMNPNQALSAGAFAFATPSSMSSLSASPFNGFDFTAGTNNGDSKGFSVENLPIIDSKTTPTTPSITFPLPGAYHISYAVDDPGSTGTVTGSNFTSVGNAILTNFSSYASAAGKGMQQFCDVIIGSPLGKVVMGALAVSGTAAGSFGTSLTVTCESLNYMLEQFGANPNPPLDWEMVQSLKKSFPKHDFSRIDRRLLEKRSEDRIRSLVIEARADAKRQFNNFLEDRADFKERIVEVSRDDVENSDGDIVVQPQARSRSADRRSKSSERNDDRGKQPR